MDHVFDLQIYRYAQALFESLARCMTLRLSGFRHARYGVADVTPKKVTGSSIFKYANIEFLSATLQTKIEQRPPELFILVDIAKMRDSVQRLTPSKRRHDPPSKQGETNEKEACLKI